MAFRLDTAHLLPTRFIMDGARVVGYLYAPTKDSPSWEIWPRGGFASAFPGWPTGEQSQSFASEHDALVYLGLVPAQVAA